ncbi:MAG TPA: SusC/RagA family TonB-linked outer membrane protein [Saprospiraceae bacterium]|nr:SusC/RagA family TonB-linked outer membrane protein [Saprospiraceae bacterium]
MNRHLLIPFRCLLSLCFVFLLVGFSYGQQKVTGTLTDDATGEPLIGANIVVKGTTTGTVADFNGNYTIMAAPGDVLVITYTGYKSHEIVVGTGMVYNVSLTPGELFEEVVVTGYGSQRAKEVTGAVSSVKSEDFNAGNVNTAAQLLQGKVAGLSIYKPGGDPNGDYNIRIRGLSTIGAQVEPLVIIDGVAGGKLSNIDPQDIESMDVLKDGSAAAIYGTRGSSGVILVTTKKGKKGTSRIDYNGYVAAESIAKLPDNASKAEFLEAGGADNGGDSDWYDAISRTGLSHAHNLSMTGGSDQTQYRASVNYRNSQGVVLNSGFDQINGSLAITQKGLNDKLTLTTNLIATDRKYKLSFPEAFRYATIFNPTSSILKPDGTFNEPGGFDLFNPQALVELNINDGQKFSFLGNVAAELEILPGLKIGGQFAKQKSTDFYGEYYPSNSLYRQGVSRHGVARRNTAIEQNNLYEATIRYTGSTGKINYNLLGGYSYQRFDFTGHAIEAGGFLTDLFTYNNIFAASERTTGNADIPSSYDNGYQLEAAFARVNLTFDDSWFFSASVRQEGSDRFGVNNKRGVFPAVSAGVDLASVANLETFDALKLRAGYGITGNLPGFSYLAYSQYVAGSGFYYNGGFVSSYGPVINANPDLKWESKNELNIGVDFAVANSNLWGTLDYFTRKTKDLILLTPVPVPPNLAPVTWLNSAAFTTSGFEIVLNYNLIKTSKFTYTPSLIFSTYNTILDKYLDGSPKSYRTNVGAPGQNLEAGQGIHLLQEGEHIGQIIAPIFESVNADGSNKFKDNDGDGDADFEDWQVVGNGLPDFEASLNNNFTIGRFDLNLFFRGAFGHSLVNMYRVFYEVNPQGKGLNVVKTKYYNEGISTASYNDTHVEDASFVKLDNATLAYNFDLGTSNAFKSARVYVTGQNLLTITGYTGVDPEVRLADKFDSDNGGREPILADQLAPGVDRRNTYYSTRTITFGVNFGF